MSRIFYTQMWLFYTWWKKTKTRTDSLILFPQLKSVGPKLVPFFKTVAIYFVLLIPEERPSLFAMLIKCLPIISLIVFVLLHGMSLGDEWVHFTSLVWFSFPTPYNPLNTHQSHADRFCTQWQQRLYLYFGRYSLEYMQNTKSLMNWNNVKYLVRFQEVPSQEPNI